MASYTVNAGERGAYAKTLVASTVDTVTFTSDVDQLEVVNEGTTGIFVRLNGAVPAVGDAAAWYVPPSSARTINVGNAVGLVVKLISSGTPTYSVSDAA